MTGSPLFRLALLLAGLVVLAIPAWQLTGRSAPAPKQTAPVGPDATTPQLVQLVFASPLTPTTIVVTAHGETIATLDPSAGTWWVEFYVPLPPEGIDLVIHATWPGSQATNALRVQARAGIATVADTTLWGNPGVEDVVTLSGGENQP